METKYKTFKPFDKVLVRDHEEVWQPDLYGFWDKCRDRHYTMMNYYIADEDILSYEGNEHLLGTTDEPDVPLSEKETQDAYWANCSEVEKKNLRKSYNDFLKYDVKGRSILETVCGKHNLQDEVEEEIKLEKGELLICNNDIKLLMDGVGFVTPFCYADDNAFYTGKSGFVNADYNYVIKFSNFNPNDKKETNKHILCVKNGKIVRYKE